MIWRQAIITCFQRGNKILADTHLKISQDGIIATGWLAMQDMGFHQQ
jgi:hypothetical protein